MYIKVHRGTRNIGGNLVEIGTSNTRLLFDAGASLPPLDDPHAEDGFELEGLTFGRPAFDRVFISHHHNDHCGLLKKLLPGIPVSAGSETKRILEIIADFTGQPRPEIDPVLQDGQTVQLNNMRVTPLAVTHSARDAYMFLIQADGQNVLYTGDFREASDVPERVRALLGPDGRLDVLLSEGTNIRREPQEASSRFHGEDWVARRAAGRMRLYPGTVFVLCSSTNGDRIDAIARAAAWTGRTVCGDLFLAAVRGRADDSSEAAWQRFVANYVDEAETPRIWPYFQLLYQERALVGAEGLARLPGQKVIFVRTSMIPFMKKYLEARQEKGCLLIYSMWKGYKPSKATKQFLDFCAAQNISVEDIHCSGHACRETVEALIRDLAPAALVPIHCEAGDREEFRSLHQNCEMLDDGERWEVGEERAPSIPTP